MLRLWPYLALFGSGLCWGLGLPFGKLALAETDASHMILLRFLVAGIAVAPIALRTREARARLRKPMVLICGAFYAFGFLAQFEGLAHTSVTLAALLVGVMPILIAVSAAALGEKVGAPAWAGVATATLGALLVGGRPEGGSAVGVLLCLVSLPLFLVWLYAGRAAGKGEPAIGLTCSTLFAAALILLVLVTALHGPPRLALSPRAWIGIVGQGLLSTVAATLCWQIGAPRAPAAAAGVFINVEPVVGTFLGMLLFGERPGPPTFVGGALILVGSLIVVLFEHRRPEGVHPAEDAPTPA